MAEAPRKHAAIVSVDIAGFSALAERDAAQALSLVGQIACSRQRLPRIASSRIFNTAGDGLMLEFATASEGLGAAITLCERKPIEATLAYVG
jgi:class 3 adenylate cyclase